MIKIQHLLILMVGVALGYLTAFENDASAREELIPSHEHAEFTHSKFWYESQGKKKVVMSWNWITSGERVSAHKSIDLLPDGRIPIGAAPMYEKMFGQKAPLATEQTIFDGLSSSGWQLVSSHSVRQSTVREGSYGVRISYTFRRGR